MSKPEKIVMIGLDGLNPDLVYMWQDELPTFKKLMEEGIHGRIKSTVPPITPQAWSCVLSGKNPGHFGFWDFTYRDDYSYGQSKLVSSKIRDSRVKTLYHILPDYDKKVAIVNVPVTYPPPEVKNGYSISCFMTPSLDKDFTYPSSLKDEIKKVIGEYIIDASTSDMNFRQMEKDVVLKRIYDMDKQRFDLTEFFIKEKKCDFVFTVVMGTDRMPHLFYRYFDKNHIRYTPHPVYKDALKNHYKFCDENIKRILEIIDDKTCLIITSDHSVQRLDGRINLNEWLIKEGYMTLKKRPEKLTPLMAAEVDWEKTKVWATGFTGQIYLNVKGREKYGIVDPKDYDKLLDELSEKFKKIPAEDGRKLETVTFKRKDIHKGEYAKYGPDLFIYFDMCRFNISELIGYPSIYSYDTPKGPDDGGHGPYGFFVMAGKGVPKKGKIEGADLLDIAPTILYLFDIPIPDDMEGKVLTKEESVYSEEDEKEIRERLSRLGYLG